MIRESGPSSACNCPIASISAMRALDCASAMAAPCEDLRSVMEERLNKPTASKANSTISVSVATSAKPPPDAWLPL